MVTSVVEVVHVNQQQRRCQPLDALAMVNAPLTKHASGESVEIHVIADHTPIAVSKTTNQCAHANKGTMVIQSWSVFELDVDQVMNASELMHVSADNVYRFAHQMKSRVERTLNASALITTQCASVCLVSVEIHSKLV